MTRSRRGGPDGRDHLLIYADGAVQPSRAGVGIVAIGLHGQIVRAANRLLPTMTNNEAEYAGLLLALETAVALQTRFLEVRLDSEIVVYQMAGRFAVNSPALKRWHQQACALAATIFETRYTYVPRDRNRLADALATEASFGRLWTTDEVARP